MPINNTQHHCGCGQAAQKEVELSWWQVPGRAAGKPDALDVQPCLV